MSEGSLALSAHSSFCSRLFAPKVTIEKGATALAVAALALTIIGALAFRIHYPATVAFLNEQAVRIGLMAGGGALFIGVIISLVIREMRQKNPNDSIAATASLTHGPPTLQSVEEELDALKPYLEGNGPLRPRTVDGRYESPPEVAGKYQPFYKKLSLKQQILREELQRGETENWDRLAGAIREGAHCALPWMSTGREEITWLIGTPSATLIGMDRAMEADDLTERPALISTESNVFPGIQLSYCLEAQKNAEKTFNFSDREVSSLTTDESGYLKRSFPIVWGSTKELVYQRLVGVIGPLGLGEEIDVAFTDGENIQRLRRWLDAHDCQSVTVLDLKALHFLAGQLTY